MNKLDYEALITSILTMLATVAGAFLRDDNLTDEEKAVLVDRVNKAQELVPEWK